MDETTKQTAKMIRFPVLGIGLVVREASVDLVKLDGTKVWYLATVHFTGKVELHAGHPITISPIVEDLDLS